MHREDFASEFKGYARRPVNAFTEKKKMYTALYTDTDKKFERRRLKTCTDTYRLVETFV